MFLKKLILFLIRKRLGLAKYENFQFVNQSDKREYYWFNDTELRKYDCRAKGVIRARVSLNWLLDDECEIVKVNINDIV